jgi:hypothetical protein
MSLAICKVNPVGQGLFVSGAVCSWGAASKPKCHSIRWVYDCGFESGTKVSKMTEVIKRCFNFTPVLGIEECCMHHHDGERVDILFISHFDNDHINGIKELIEHYKFRYVVLPVIPLANRVATLVEGRIEFGSEEFEFVLNPVSFLRSLGRLAGCKIVLVEGSDLDSVPPFGLSGERSPDSSDSPLIVFEKESHRDLSSLHYPDLVGSASEPVSVIPSGGRIVSPILDWEFVPYNDVKFSGFLDRSFVVEVDKLRNSLLSGSRADRKSAIDSLKKEYEKKYKNARSRNGISLFICGGSLGSTSTKSIGAVVGQGQMGRLFNRSVHEGYGGMLFTGDGYLAKPRQLSAIKAYLGSRAVHPSAFQVMHHGARPNWFPQTAVDIAPCYSFTSSDPGHKGYRHPSPDVVKSFSLNSDQFVMCRSDLEAEFRVFW